MTLPRRNDSGATMPIQFTWKPNNKPTVSDLIDLGLELGGDDSTLAAVQDGRIKLVEVEDKGTKKGAAESTAERLIATFHGKFHYDASGKDKSKRITFEI